MRMLFLPATALWMVVASVSVAQTAHPCAEHKALTTMPLRFAEKSIDTSGFDVHHLDLEIELSNTSTYVDARAAQAITVTVPSLDSARFALHTSLTVDSLFVDGVTSPFRQTADVLAVPLPGIATSGDGFRITAFYQGQPPVASGFGDGGIYTGQSPSWGVDATWSLSQPYGSLYWWPAKQSLTDKIDSTDVAIICDDQLFGGSNGVLLGVDSLAGGRIRCRWSHRHPIADYLVSVAVSDYQEYSFHAPLMSGDSILIQNFIYDNPALLGTFEDDILETGDMMERFEEVFGPYPFADEKYGHCMAPFSGGMEHQTMTTQGFFVRSLTAHELGHQWWGDDVTCSSWHDIFLNEGFARYSEYLYDESLSDVLAANTMTSYHDNIKSEPGGSVYVPDIMMADRIFDQRLSYDKGAAMVHMLRHRVGEDAVFFSALRSFLDAFGSSSASTDDLRLHLEGETNLDLNAFFQHWFYGEGYPTIDMRWNAVGRDLVLAADQTGSVPLVTPFFTTALEVEAVLADGSDTLVRTVWTSPDQEITVPLLDSVVDVTRLDPNGWVLMEEGAITKDTSLEAMPVGLRDRAVGSLRMAPNPATDVVRIQTPEGIRNGRIILIDALGRTVGSAPMEADRTAMDVSHLSPGIYRVRLLSGAIMQAAGRLVRR